MTEQHLLTIDAVKACQLYDGEEIPLAEGQLMLTAHNGSSVLTIHPDLTIPLESDTNVISRSPYTYIIPIADVESASIRIDLPQSTPADLCEYFEHYLGELCAFEAASTQVSEKAPIRNALVLIDEDDGSIVGRVSEDLQIRESPILSRPGHEKDAVLIDLAEPSPSASPSPLGLTRPPVLHAESAASITDKEESDAFNTTARFIGKALTVGAGAIGSSFHLAAQAYTKRTKPGTATSYTPRTKESFRKVKSATDTAARYSGVASGAVVGVANRVGAQIASTVLPKQRTNAKTGQPTGLRATLAKASNAFNIVADSAEDAGKHILNESSTAIGTVVGHTYGPDAQAAAMAVGGSVKNLGLVYIDAMGVTRRALLKGVAQGAIKYKKINKETGKVEEGEIVVQGEGVGGIMGASGSVSGDEKRVASSIGEAVQRIEAEGGQITGVVVDEKLPQLPARPVKD